MIFIKYVCRVNLRMSDEELEIGDYAIHGEEPYTFEYYNRDFKKLQIGYEHRSGKVVGGHDVEKMVGVVGVAGEGSSGHGSSGGHDGVLVGQDPEISGGSAAKKGVVEGREVKED